MSLPLALSTQAISSRLVRSMASHELRTRNFLSIVILSSLDCPQMSAPSVIIGLTGIMGLSSQRESSMSGASTILNESSSCESSLKSVLPSERKAVAISLIDSMVWDRPSTATITLLFSLGKASVANHWGIGTCSGTLILCSSIPVPGRSFPACMKYLVSVHKPAWSIVMTISPASPENPLTHSTCFHLGEGYSLLWGSDPVIITASQPREDIISRMASTLAKYLFMTVFF